MLLLPTSSVDQGEVSPEGGTFAFMQFFQLDKTLFSDATHPQLENMIGRDVINSESLARPDEHCHIKRARLIDPKDGSNTELLRQSLPFNTPKGPPDLDRGPMNDGVFFVAFGQSAKVFSDILGNIFGDKKAFIQDLLIKNVQGR